MQFSVDYPARPLNRLSTAFRIFLMIPIAILLGIVNGEAIQVTAPCRRAASARSSSTATIAANSAAAAAIRAICQPGMPPAAAGWIPGRCCGAPAGPVSRETTDP